MHGRIDILLILKDHIALSGGRETSQWHLGQSKAVMATSQEQREENLEKSYKFSRIGWKRKL